MISHRVLQWLPWLFEKASVKGVVRAVGALNAGDIQGLAILGEALELSNSI
jgi:hypothetical protein